MDLFELQAFVTLANSLHFTKAATAIHLSPSALSRLLARLESEVQSILIERDTRQIRLTEEGKIFLEFAQEVLHKKDDLDLRLVTGKNKLKGILRIYASVTACYSVLPPFAENLAALHPELRLSVQTGDPSNAAEAVREGKAELALDAKPDKDFSDIDFFPVKKTALVFVASNTRDVRTLLPSELAGLSPYERMKHLITYNPLILPNSGTARERMDKWLRFHDMKAQIAAETAGNEAVLALARLGIGVGLVPEIVLENSPFAEGIKTIDIGNELGFYEIGFLQKANTLGSALAQQFRTEIGKIIISIYKTTPVTPFDRLSPSEKSVEE